MTDHTAARLGDELWTQPLWRPDDLGRAIPESPNATSVCLPLWDHVVGYERGDPGVVDKLTCGYPRFVFHQAVRDLFAHHQGEPDTGILVVPSTSVAERLIAYINRHTGLAAHSAAVNGLVAVRFPAEAAAAAKDFWQHCGEIVSSRRARAALSNSPDNPSAGLQAEDELQQRLAQIYGVPADWVFLFTNGMAAMAAAKRIVDAVGQSRPTVQLGFPYVDVLKVQQQFGGGARFLPGVGDDTIDQLEALVATQAISGCVVETPGNPLLTCPDLARLSAILRPINAALVVDDTVGSPANIDVLPMADVIVGSLTKYVAGTGDVMGGSLVINPGSPLAKALRATLRGEHESLLWWEDAVVLAEHSRDYVQRIRQINANADCVAAWLNQHPAVRSVWHPSLATDGHYAAIRRPHGGNGGLLSFIPHEPETWSPVIYDHLRVSKGPSLGMNYTLACPYTLLAHFHELDWAESHGVSRWLIRVSVGLEDPNDLIDRFAAALDVRAE